MSIIRDGTQKLTSRHASPQVSRTGPSIPQATARNHQNVPNIADTVIVKTYTLIRVIRGSDRKVRMILGILLRSDRDTLDVGTT